MHPIAAKDVHVLHLREHGVDIVVGLQIDAIDNDEKYDETTRELAKIVYFVSVAGNYDPVHDQISIHDNDRSDTITIFHELGHWTGHSTRLARPWMVKSQKPRAKRGLDPEDIAREERIADEVADILGSMYGWRVPPSNPLPESVRAVKYIEEHLGLPLGRIPF